jgi:hypothetical protein
MSIYPSPKAQTCVRPLLVCPQNQHSAAWKNHPWLAAADTAMMMMMMMMIRVFVFEIIFMIIYLKNKIKKI